MGREVSLGFLHAGAHVIATYRRQEEFDTLVADAGGGNASAAPTGAVVDTTDARAVGAMVKNLIVKHGRLDILVNAVGGYSGRKNVWEEDPKTYERMMALNIASGFALSRAAVPAMIRQKRGWIVRMSRPVPATDTRLGPHSTPPQKAGALALFDSLAEEVSKPYAINVNSVVPSIFDTPANRAAMPNADYAQWPKPAEIARVILFLCSEEARVIHGAAIPVCTAGRETVSVSRRWWISAPGTCGSLEMAAEREWLVTNGLGGYACGTVSGALTRRYHSLLVCRTRCTRDDGCFWSPNSTRHCSAMTAATYALGANR